MHKWLHFHILCRPRVWVREYLLSMKNTCNSSIIRNIWLQKNMKKFNFICSHKPCLLKEAYVSYLLEIHVAEKKNFYGKEGIKYIWYIILLSVVANWLVVSFCDNRFVYYCFRLTSSCRWEWCFGAPIKIS